MDKQEVRDFINEMIDVLRESGWCQEVLEDGAGRLCVLGARDVVDGRQSMESCADFFQMNEFLISAAAARGMSRQSYKHPVAQLNDNIFTCEDDAVRFLKEAKESL